MPSRIVLAPPEPWSEEKLLAAARALPEKVPDVHVGDAVGELLVVGVERAEKPVVEVVPRGVPRATRHIDVTVLLDIGASMGERWSAQHSREEAARESLQAFLRQAPARVATVRVLAFGSDVYEAVPRMTPVAIREVPPATPKGKARAGRALQRALEGIAAEPGSRAHAVLLLTDGPSEPAELRAAAERAGRLGIPVHVVVFAPQEHDDLARVASASGGTLQRAMLPLTIEFPEESS